MNSGHGITPLTPGAGSRSPRELGPSLTGSWVPVSPGTGSRSPRELGPGQPGSWVLASPGAGSSANELIFAMYVEVHIELGCEFRTWDHPSNPRSWVPSSPGARSQSPRELGPGLPGSWVPASPGAGFSTKELIFAMYVEVHIELGCEFRTWDHPSNPRS